MNRFKKKTVSWGVICHRPGYSKHYICHTHIQLTMKSTTLLVAIGAALLLLQAAAVVAEVGSDSDNTNNGNQNQITHVALDDSSFWSTLSRDSTRGWLVALYAFIRTTVYSVILSYLHQNCNFVFLNDS